MDAQTLHFAVPAAIPSMTPPLLTPLTPAIATVQRDLVQLRMLGYIGVQFSALLVPLLVFKLSGSAALAGMALFIEWLPKLGLYLVGGSLVEHIGSARAHRLLDVSRLVALAGLWLAAVGGGSLCLVAGSAALYQCANAMSNILFERAVTLWWAPSSRSEGHTRMLKSDQWGCLVALLLGLAIPDAAWLALAALVLQTAATAQVMRRCARVYAHAPAHHVTQTTLLTKLGQDARALQRGILLRFACACALVGIPAALVFSTLTFYLERAHAGAAANARWLALLLLVRAGFSIGILQLVQGLLRRGAGMERNLAWVGGILLLLGSLATAWTLPLWGMLTAVVVLGMSSNLYLPRLRHLRQGLIAAHIPERSRAGVTGMLISVEACAYLVAAFLMKAMGQNLAALSASATVLALLGVLLLARIAVADDGGARVR